MGKQTAQAEKVNSECDCFKHLQNVFYFDLHPVWLFFDWLVVAKIFWYSTLSISADGLPKANHSDLRTIK